MRRVSVLMGAVAVTALAGCGGGDRNKPTNGPATSGTSGTSGVADVNGGRPLTLQGCVEDGVPAGTYVLRISRPAGGEADGTSASLYHLIPTGNIDFGQNLGKEVTISGEIANQARDNTVGTTGPVGGKENSGPPVNDRRKREGTSGEGDAGTNLESGSSRGSGGGRVQGDAADQNAGARFFRVTSMNKVADSCGVEK